jgi:ribosomal-protein-alanine N-acetyltransferase
MVAPEAELLKIVVRKEYRRQGVASLLLGRLVKELRRQKIETLFLEVRAANRGATAFYRQQAFSQVGVRSRYYSNPPDSALIFCRSLR